MSCACEAVSIFLSFFYYFYLFLFFSVIDPKMRWFVLIFTVSSFTIDSSQKDSVASSAVRMNKFFGLPQIENKNMPEVYWNFLWVCHRIQNSKYKINTVIEMHKVCQGINNVEDHFCRIIYSLYLVLLAACPYFIINNETLQHSIGCSLTPFKKTRRLQRCKCNCNCRF